MWKNLKGYFIIEEEGKPGPKKSTLPDRRREPARSASTPDPAPASPPEDAEGGEVADRFVEVLLQAMERANLPGFDYLEFKKALRNLEKMDFDDALRFQSAYAAAQSMGVTPQQLVESANHYLRALGAEQDKFAAALTKQRADQITGKEEQVKQLESSIAEQEKRIKTLQEQIARTRQQQKQLQDTIERSKTKISATAADFQTTYRTIAGSIEEDIGKMKQYLK